MRLKPSSEAMVEMFSRRDEALERMVAEYRSGRHASQPWRTVPAARLSRVWQDFARTGFVRDSRSLDRIADVFVENVLRLWVNTDSAEHGSASKEDVLGEHFEPGEMEGFVSWAVDTETGWRISDYGLDALVELAALLSEAEGDEERLVVLDRMLNVTHQRSDLASWFVEGGSRTLSDLSSRPCGAETTPAP